MRSGETVCRLLDWRTSVLNPFGQARRPVFVERRIGRGIAKRQDGEEIGDWRPERDLAGGEDGRAQEKRTRQWRGAAPGTAIAAHFFHAGM